MRTIYSTPTSKSTQVTRISVLQNTLQQLRLSNIATLDAILTHFTRLLELTSADEAYASALSTVLSPCILRPKTETSLTMEEKYSYRLIRDLFTYKNEIFEELKRSSAYSPSSISSDDSRPRAVSSDESNRKANMEARARAIKAAGGNVRSRATSPATARGHRGDRNSTGAETRFPIQTSPTDLRTPRSTTRHSLEVPMGLDGAAQPEVTSTNMTPLHSISNGSEIPQTSATYIPGSDDTLDGISVEKRNSLSRSTPVPPIPNRFTSRKSVGFSRMSLNQDLGQRNSLSNLNGPGDEYIPSSNRVGVNLTDKSM